MARTCGLLLHITSLPSAFGIGDLGPEAHRFAEFLALAGQRHWQILPVNPTAPHLGNSPYSAHSAFAGHPLLISPEFLVEDGYLPAPELDDYRMPQGPVDFARVTENKERMLRRVFHLHRSGLEKDREFDHFCWENGIWLNDHAMFTAVKQSAGSRRWVDWPAELRDRVDAALSRWGHELGEEVLYEKFRQFLFFRQWSRLRRTLATLGLELMGDIPIYVTLDSADVWSNRHIFKLDALGRPTCVAGVPPDYFAKEGQRWGNPVFDWDASRAQEHSWWFYRIRHNFGLFDSVRLDHFRGFAAYWEIPAAEKTAVGGTWKPGPGADFFERLFTRHGRLNLVAEDLGIITRDVVALRKRFGLPGMRVVQFGLGDDAGHNANAVHNHEPDNVVYTGTHDNETARGWFDQATPAERERLSAFAGTTATPANAADLLIRLAHSSCARTCIVPVQDVLGLDASARMNTPGVAEGNWAWRMAPGSLTETHAQRLAELATRYGRDGKEIFMDDHAY